ncbi:hypothetical protein MJG53_000101 [Ovis ammon polii x Ovis aries]|nr:hypothetical protein MJG53_000101 [Ovis ammon polii x Ovis aries]
MDLGVLLECPQGREILLIRCEGNAGNSFPTKQGKDPTSRATKQKRGSSGGVRDLRASSQVETGLSHVHTWWESILGLIVKAVQGKQVPLEWTDTSGGLLELWHDPGVPLAFLWRAPPLEMRRECREFFPYETGKGSLISRYEAETGLPWMSAGPSCFLSSGDRCERNAGNSFPTKQGKDPTSRATKQKRGSSGGVRHLRASSQLETGLSHVHTWWESILGLIVKAVQGKQVPLEWTDTSGGLLELWHDPGVPLAFLWRAPPLEMRRERREFFPYETGTGSLISRYEAETGLPWMSAGPSCFLSSGDRCERNAGNSFPTKQGKDPTSRATKQKRGSSGGVRHLRASSQLETGLSHVHTWWESILGLIVKAVQGKQVPLEWTDTSGGLLELWHDPGVPLAFLWRAPPLEMRRECREFFPYETGKGSLISRYEAETGLPWMSAGPSCFLSSGDRCERNAGNSFPTKQGKDPTSRATKQKRGSSGGVRHLRASSQLETGLSHVHTWWESILDLDVKVVQGKQFPLDRTDTSGGLLEWWHNPGVPLAFPVQSASS